VSVRGDSSFEQWLDAYGDVYEALPAGKHTFMASYEQWLESFQEAYGAPDRASELACPNCGVRQHRLRLVIYGDRENNGHVAFWWQLPPKSGATAGTPTGFALHPAAVRAQTRYRGDSRCVGRRETAIAPGATPNICGRSHPAAIAHVESSPDDDGEEGHAEDHLLRKRDPGSRQVKSGRPFAAHSHPARADGRGISARSSVASD
jgi:hypothetical protein